jgi:hypothetical protein
MFSTVNKDPVASQLMAALRYANATQYSGLKNIAAENKPKGNTVSNANRKAFIKARLQRNYNNLKSRIGSLTPEEVQRMRNLNKGMRNLNGGTRKNRKNHKNRKDSKGHKATKKRSTRRR